MRHRPRVLVVPGAMVDIGLGPTNGSDFLVILRSGSPRRVQTDAYHRPRILNYVPCHITSFFRFPPSGSNIVNTPKWSCQQIFYCRRQNSLHQLFCLVWVRIGLECRKGNRCFTPFARAITCRDEATPNGDKFVEAGSSHWGRNPGKKETKASSPATQTAPQPARFVLPGASMQ